ncbi:hypothetical protein MNV49_006062 [Pseudohyphozyma bogoriensis]|nr:hypothetical protein MNV49_006062 [Pseudohyphozyma bogoriensis]
MTTTEDPNSYWRVYDPSHSFAIAATAIFGVAAVVHIVLMIARHSSRYMWPFVFATVMEAVGYAFRANSAEHHDSKAYYAVQLCAALFVWSFLSVTDRNKVEFSVLLIVAPAFYAAMVYGRLLIAHEMQRASFLPKKVVTPLFVIVDILSFFVQVVGGVMSTSDSVKTVNDGANVLKVGFIVQIVGNGVFILAVVIAGFRARKFGNRLFTGGLWVIGIGATIIFVRTIYRFLQIIIKNGDSYPLSKYEWEFIVFDFCFIAPLSFMFAMLHPSRFLNQWKIDRMREGMLMSQPGHV